MNRGPANQGESGCRIPETGNRIGRLRAILLKQWKRKRTRARRLIQLGVRSKTAWETVYKGRCRLWALSHTPAVDRGLRNAFFAERGLIFLADWFTAHRGWDVIAQAGPGFQPRLPLG